MLCLLSLVESSSRSRRLITIALILTLLATMPIGQAVLRGEDTSAGKESSEDSYGLHYAKIYLQLMQLNLQKVQQANTRVPSTIPSTVIDNYKQDVDIAKKLLDATQKGDPDYSFGVYLRLAKASLMVAQSDLKRATQANQGNPGTISDLDMQRLKLRAELAQITLDEGSSLIDAPDAQQHTWQLNMICVELLRMKEQVNRLLLNR